MNALAFFPWFHTGHVVSLDGFRLIPYRRGRLPGGTLQPTLDVLLDPFLETTKPIRQATLVGHESRDLIAGVSEAEVDELFQLRDIIAFSAIAEREFFGIGLTYCNRDAFVLVVHDFEKEKPAATVARTFRRRDGTKRCITSRPAQAERRPGHVDSGFAVSLDESLACALVDASRRLALWPNIEDALRFYNDANSDADQVREQAECVYLVSAFERLLDCRTGKENDLVTRFMRVWHIAERVPRESCRRPLPRASAGSSLTEIWLRDLFRHRGNYAHGVLNARHSPVWNMRETLLLGSYIFPLLMKRVLSSHAVYVFSKRDEEKVQIVEHLLAEADLFVQEEDPESGARWPWDRVRENQAWRVLREPTS